MDTEVCRTTLMEVRKILAVNGWRKLVRDEIPENVSTSGRVEFYRLEEKIVQLVWEDNEHWQLLDFATVGGA